MSERTPRQRRFLEITLWFGTILGAVAVYGVVFYLELGTLIIGVGLLVTCSLLLSAVHISRAVSQEIAVLESQTNYLLTEDFAMVAERSPVASLTIEANGQITAVNTAAVHLLQAEESRLLQSNFYTLVSETLTESGDTVLTEKIRSGATITDVEVALTTLQHDLVWVLLSVFPTYGSETRVLSLVDITERKKVDTAKSEFVALATHQLRTPIAAIRWNHELLTKKIQTETPDQLSKYLERIGRNTQQMTNLINDFLNVSKLEMGTFATDASDVSVQSFIASITEEFAERISKKELSVNVRVEPVGAQIHIDPRLLHIIVSNLVSNAVKYTREQGMVAISFTGTESGCQFVVQDSGIGIPETEMRQLFTKFFRASNAHTQETEGTGLGLYVIKQSAETLGGSIDVTSVEGEGTTFTVTLPQPVITQR